MKIKDLEKAQKDGTTVAFSQFDGMDSDHAYEVRVINPRGVRSVPNSERMWGRHDAPGCVIEHVAVTHGTEDEHKRDTVAYTKLVGTWAEYTERRNKRHEYQASRDLRRELSKDSAEKTAAALKARLEAAHMDYAYNAVEVVGIGGGYQGGSGRWTAPYAYAVRVQPAILDWLMSEKEDS